VTLNLPTIGAIWRAEMRMLLRDRRTLVAAILLPLLVMPLMLFAVSWVHQQRVEHLETTVYRYAITGSQAELARALVAQALERRQANDPERPVPTARFEEQSREAPRTALDPGDLHFILDAHAGARARRLRDALDSGDLHFFLEALTAEESHARERSDDPAETDDPARALNATDVPETIAPELPASGAPVIRVVFRADREQSTAGMQAMSGLLRRERLAQRETLLEARGFPLRPTELASVTEINVATEGQVAGLTLGRVLTLFLLLFLLPSAAVVATDSLAGEKERGTLETLLTTAAGRIEIIAAKHLGILTVTLGITLIQAANLLVYVGFELIPLPAGLSAAVTPGVALLLGILYLPVAALVAGVLLVTSGYARSYKEAQLYFLPVFLLGMVPALAPFLPGVPLRSVIVLAPVANVAVAVREILTGAFDWPMITLSWFVTAAAALWVLYWGVRFLGVEKLVSGTDSNNGGAIGGLALFQRHVLRWFAVLWACLIIVSGYFPPTADLRVQVVVNILVLFLGASLFILWRYRLDPRAALALRAPRPMVWLAVLLGVPGGMLTGIGVFRLADLFIPIPPELIEAFSQGLLPDTIPFWQLLVFLAVIPGIVEEITFRGILLHGLHRRLRPVALVLVVGAIFGLFHGSLFRILPTAFLGVLFATITLLTGSLYPAILWHILHNASSVLAGYAELPLGSLDPSVHITAAALLAAALWILWRHRTPYPDLGSELKS
jgi:sodium transport system permease protein